MAEVTFETNLHLDRLLGTDPKMRAAFQRAVKKVLTQARNTMRGKVRGVSDKEAELAIRKSVYKRILGGNINIITPRYRAGRTAPLPPVVHQLETRLNSKGNHRGGNRIPRSRRTEALLTYWGSDKGFVLRFLNGGTQDRNNGYGNRGNIAARHWFGPMSQKELEAAAQQLDEMMDKIVNEILNKQ